LRATSRIIEPGPPLLPFGLSFARPMSDRLGQTAGHPTVAPRRRRHGQQSLRGGARFRRRAGIVEHRPPGSNRRAASPLCRSGRRHRSHQQFRAATATGSRCTERKRRRGAERPRRRGLPVRVATRAARGRRRGKHGPTGEIMAPVGTLGFEAAAGPLRNRRQALAAVAPECSGSRRCRRGRGRGGDRGGPRPQACRSSARELRHERPHDDGAGAADLARSTRAPDGPMASRADCGGRRLGGREAILNLAGSARAGCRVLVASQLRIPEAGDPATTAARADGSYARLALDAGARIIGGCCGTRGHFGDAPGVERTVAAPPDPMRVRGVGRGFPLARARRRPALSTARGAAPGSRTHGSQPATRLRWTSRTDARIRRKPRRTHATPDYSPVAIEAIIAISGFGKASVIADRAGPEC